MIEIVAFSICRAKHKMNLSSSKPSDGNLCCLGALEHVSPVIGTEVLYVDVMCWFHEYLLLLH